jgi:hypothetical protein
LATSFWAPISTSAILPRIPSASWRLSSLNWRCADVKHRQAANRADVLKKSRRISPITLSRRSASLYALSRSVKVDVNTDDSSTDAPATEHGPWVRRFSRIPRDVILIVLGAALAFGSEEWRDARQRRERVAVAVASIRSEVTLNRTLVAQAREFHRGMADTLGKLVARSSRASPGRPPARPEPWQTSRWRRS